MPEFGLDGGGVELKEGGVLVQQPNKIEGIGKQMVVVGLQRLDQPDRDLALVRCLLDGEPALLSSPPEGLSDALLPIHLAGSPLTLRPRPRTLASHTRK